MAYEQRDNSGSLFKNERKVKGDNKPNMTGKAMIDGVMYFFDAWTKESSKGRYQSVSFKRMDTQESAAPTGHDKPAPKGYQPPAGSIDDDLPPF
ncbi:hypothetical protein [Massilia sp. CCM 8734]|uniref:hypothetical protein n=1 Tax=Massilia sp. CCM 8734 TaxID=2609283 RepID=UPI001420984D|nr:hypothetical protein [Massilia sp. CCM 8734]NHZ94628.1 hypothetical protein [Massilia sp. CCM 8734]